MKLKTVILSILIVLLSGTVFYFGWIQIHLPENYIGIAFTKSEGYLDTVYKPGKFSWDYRRLIPGNFRLLKFRLEPQYLSVASKGELPSGTAFSEVIPGTPDFSFLFRYSITYLIRAESLPEIVREESLNPDRMDDKYNELNALFENTASSFLSSSSSSGTQSYNNTLNTEAVSVKLKEYLESKFSYIEFLQVNITEYSVPDTAVYLRAKQIYLDSVESANRVISDSKALIAEKKIKDAANFETLREYGKLLTEYPALIDFFSVIKIDTDGLIPRLDLQIPETPDE